MSGFWNPRRLNPPLLSNRYVCVVCRPSITGLDTGISPASCRRFDTYQLDLLCHLPAALRDTYSTSQLAELESHRRLRVARLVRVILDEWTAWTDIQHRRDSSEISGSNLNHSSAQAEGAKTSAVLDEDQELIWRARASLQPNQAIQVSATEWTYSVDLASFCAEDSVSMPVDATGNVMVKTPPVGPG